MLNQEALFPMPQQASTSDDYWTPKWIFDALGVEFDLDVACPPDGPAHTPAKAWYTQETDGLASPWFGTVWMNPPFSNNKLWIEKFILHKNGIGLTMMSKSQAFRSLWQTAHGIVPLPHDWKFIQPDGVRADVFMPCVLVAFGNENVQALHRANIGRVR
jgi:hypothetical protein